MVTVKVLEDMAIPWTPEEDTNYGGVQILDDKGEVVEAGGTVDLDTGLAQILYSQGYVEDVDGVLVGGRGAGTGGTGAGTTGSEPGKDEGRPV